MLGKQSYGAVDVSLLEADGEPAAENERYLIFTVSGQRFGISADAVEEVAAYVRPEPVPGFPAFARGVASLHGRMVPVVDIARRLGHAPSEYGSRSCIIVAAVGGSPVGFLADSADMLAELPDVSIEPPPALGGSGAAAFVAGVASADGRPVLLLDFTKLLSRQELDCLGSSGPAEK